jgi:signal transduction histidine kinase
VTSIRANSIDALTEMRSMIGLLRGDGAEDEPLSPGRVEELHRLVTSARASGTDVHIDGDFTPGAHRTTVLPAAVDHAAYRIVQEALTNAVVHAPGAATSVDIRCDGDALTIVITNDMTPTDSDHPGRVDGRTGTGLANMRQRAELLGGMLHAGCEGDRWCVKAVLPVEKSTAR